MSGVLVPPVRRAPSGDAGSMVLGWLVKLAVGLALVGVVAFDLIAVGVARVSTKDSAALVADAAQDVVLSGGDPALVMEQARQLAATTAAEHSVTLEQIAITPDGTVSVTVSRPITTLVLAHVGFARPLTVARSSTVQEPPTR